MASRAQYVLRVAGRIKGDVNDKTFQEMKARLESIFKKPTGPGRASISNQPGEDWPRGFILDGYEVCQWKLAIDEPYKPVHDDDKKKKVADKKKGRVWPEDHMVNFRAEIHHTLEGSLFLNRQVMLPQVGWFYHNRDFKWHEDLMRDLTKFNKDYIQQLLEPVWFREWQWYCGNGGC